nr:MAG TPA: hypothetical protein [Caudoviricetes sp.]
MVGFESLPLRQRENRGNTPFPRFFFYLQRFQSFALLCLSCANCNSSAKITRKLHTNYR